MHPVSTPARQRVGANSYSWMWSATARACVAQLLSLGFDEFELMTMPGHLWPQEMSHAQRADFRDWLAGQGATVRSLNHPGADHNLGSPIPEMRAYSVSVFKRLVVLAAELGCPVVVVVPGRANPLLPVPGDQYGDWMHDSISELLPLARDRNVRLAIENVPVSAIPRASQVVELVRRLDSGNVGICYDVANAHFIGEDPSAAMPLVAPWLDVLHLADTDRQRWRHDVVGTGSVDFAGAMQAARDCGHARMPLLELCIPEAEAGHRLSCERLRALAAAPAVNRKPE